MAEDTPPPTTGGRGGSRRPPRPPTAAELARQAALREIARVEAARYAAEQERLKGPLAPDAPVPALGSGPPRRRTGPVRKRPPVTDAAAVPPVTGAVAVPPVEPPPVEQPPAPVVAAPAPRRRVVPPSVEVPLAASVAAATPEPLAEPTVEPGEAQGRSGRLGLILVGALALLVVMLAGYAFLGGGTETVEANKATPAIVPSQDAAEPEPTEDTSSGEPAPSLAPAAPAVPGSSPVPLVLTTAAAAPTPSAAAPPSAQQSAASTPTPQPAPAPARPSPRPTPARASTAPAPSPTAAATFRARLRYRTVCYQRATYGPDGDIEIVFDSDRASGTSARLTISSDTDPTSRSATARTGSGGTLQFFVPLAGPGETLRVSSLVVAGVSGSTDFGSYTTPADSSC